MLSFNHYAFGAVADWMHRVVGGLAPAAPGWRELRIAPQPGGGLHVRVEPARHVPTDSRRRRGSSATARVTVRAVVPPNTTAQVQLPGSRRRVRGRGRGALLDRAFRAAAAGFAHATVGRHGPGRRLVTVNDAIRPGQVWNDTKGNRIQAHGGSMHHENGTFYWYGENKETDEAGKRRLALGRSVLLVHRPVQLDRPRVDHPARSRRPDLAAAPRTEDGPSPHHLQRRNQAIRVLAEDHG